MRARYDLEVRQGAPSGPGYSPAWEGPVYRVTGPSADVHDNTVRFTRFAATDDVSGHVARQVAHFQALGHGFEWQVHAGDEPHDLPARLAEAGLVEGSPETVATFDLSLRLPQADLDGVQIARLSAEEDLAPVGALSRAVYGDAEHADYIVHSLEAERAHDPKALAIYVASAADQVVSAGWIRLPARSGFASLWGGATLERWRGRGIYRALVAHRAQEARARGFTHLIVDCGPLSLPILKRLGFQPLTVVTPWFWRPA